MTARSSFMLVMLDQLDCSQGVIKGNWYTLYTLAHFGFAPWTTMFVSTVYSVLSPRSVNKNHRHNIARVIFEPTNSQRFQHNVFLNMTSMLTSLISCNDFVLWCGSMDILYAVLVKNMCEAFCKWYRLQSEFRGIPRETLKSLKWGELGH